MVNYKGKKPQKKLKVDIYQLGLRLLKYQKLKVEKSNKWAISNGVNLEAILRQGRQMFS